ncbi:MAG: CPBP family intramembrane metalloprotease [Candidatus Izimaplasma sp.]|nr:CPBP family intramembrane metalloprotease [Candidatus Izimaplasma bacterium]
MKRHITPITLGLYFLFFILVFVIQLISVYVFNLDVSVQTNLIKLSTYTNLFFYGSLFLLFISLFFFFWKREFFRFFQSFKYQIKVSIIGIFGLIVVGLSTSQIMMWLGVTDQAANQALLEQSLGGSVFDKVLLVVFVVLLAPVVEEFIFRKVGFDIVSHFNSPSLTILLTSLAFGGIHVFTGDYIYIIVYGGLGLGLGLVYYYSKNLYTAIIVHMAWNLIGTLIMFLA